MTTTFKKWNFQSQNIGVMTIFLGTKMEHHTQKKPVGINYLQSGPEETGNPACMRQHVKFLRLGYFSFIGRSITCQTNGRLGPKAELRKQILK